VLIILVLSSLASWTIIFRKLLHLGRAQAETLKFLETFWRSKRLDSIYTASEQMPVSPVAQVFRAGYVELSKVTQAQPPPPRKARCTISWADSRTSSARWPGQPTRS